MTQQSLQKPRIWPSFYSSISCMTADYPMAAWWLQPCQTWHAFISMSRGREKRNISILGFFLREGMPKVPPQITPHVSLDRIGSHDQPNICQEGWNNHDWPHQSESPSGRELDPVFLEGKSHREGNSWNQGSVRRKKQNCWHSSW